DKYVRLIGVGTSSLSSFHATQWITRREARVCEMVLEVCGSGTREVPMRAVKPRVNDCVLFPGAAQSGALLNPGPIPGGATMSINRRSFLAAALAAGVASRWSPAAAADAKGKAKADLPTPALLVDLDAFEANLKLMAEHCKKSGIGFRPHA